MTTGILGRPLNSSDMPLAWFKAAVIATQGSHGALVTAQVIYRECLMAERKGKEWVKVSNALVADFGVSRGIKRRALELLKQAQLITVRHHNSQSPDVKVLQTTCTPTCR